MGVEVGAAAAPERPNKNNKIIFVGLSIVIDGR